MAERGKVSLWSRISSQRGSGLIEAMVALAILAVVTSSVLMGLSTSYISEGKSTGQCIAENMVRNQMEYIFAQPYQPPAATYDAITPPQGYAIVTETLEYSAGDPNIEKIRVTVYCGGQSMLVVETLRSNR